MTNKTLIFANKIIPCQKELNKVTKDNIKNGTDLVPEIHVDNNPESIFQLENYSLLLPYTLNNV